MIDRRVMALAAALLALPAASEASTPRQFFEERLRSTRRLSLGFDDIAVRAGLESVTPHLGALLRDDGPERAAMLESFSSRGRPTRASDLPLVWNGGHRRFEVLKEPLAESSDAVVHFTWWFLTAYGSLEEELRASGSTLAVGLAAIVAYQATYSTNWAYLPADLHEPAAIVSLLLLDAPGLVEAARQPAAVRRAVLEDALRRACARPRGDVRELASRLSEEPSPLSWRPSGSADGPPRWTDFRPLERACVKAMDEVARKVPNTTLRALVLAVLAPGLPDPFEQGAGPYHTAWAREFDLLLGDLEAELTDRNVEALAPRADGTMNAILRADPTVLGPLLTATGRYALAEVRSEMEGLEAQLSDAVGEARNEAVRRSEEVIVGALLKHRITSKILDLAGGDPVLEAPRMPLGETTRAYLLWSAPVRRTAGGPERRESVRVRLVDFAPSDEGPPSDRAANDGTVGGGGGTKKSSPIRPGSGVRGRRGNPPGEAEIAEDEDGSLRGPGSGPGSGGFGIGIDGLDAGIRGRSAIDERHGALHRDDSGARLPHPPTEPREDPFSLPEDARRELELREHSLRARHQSEMGETHAPKEESWLRHLAELGRTELVYGPPDAAARLERVLAARRAFMDVEGGPYASELSALAVRELFLASWLWETGARTTAELLLRDVVEFAVFAGCEAERGAERLRRSPELSLLLQLPSRARTENPPGTMTLSAPARRAVRAWTVEQKAEDLIDGSVLDLEKLHTFWERAGGRAPFWLPLPRLRRDGAWDRESPAARALDDWLQGAARALSPIPASEEEP